MRTYTYSIHHSNLPKGAEACIVWAMRQWEKASKGKIRFTKAKKADILIQGGEPPDGKIAYWYDLRKGVHSIIFDPAQPWATSWWHRFTGRLPDFRTLALHEIGHVLLGPDHSNDPESIMYFKPKQAVIDNTTLKLLSFVCILLITSCRTHVPWVKTEYIYHPLFAEGNIFANH